MQKILFLFVFFLTFQLTYGQNKNDKNVELIKSAREASNQAIAKHDIDGISKFWYNDFVQIRGNSTYLTGKDTIVASWRKLFNDNPNVVYIRTPSQIIISTNDTLAWENGTWKAFNSYSNGGNYSAMWRKSNDTWKILAELFVSLF
ncbi:nuclear transport factor 2 family protein [Daejeonella sp.]|uniref:YybH family protein n=1 Tax=Daejeonella sp. TaxID=2805397 RepID=UPI00272F1FCC|nr:nuclear transport factor 2 family protein [Daejeonella sp.]MDP2413577.1 nuclear transport factor 2 family protein [Daejeonella sp.]